MLANLRIQSGVQGGSIMMWSGALERIDGIMREVHGNTEATSQDII